MEDQVCGENDSFASQHEINNMTIKNIVTKKNVLSVFGKFTQVQYNVPV